MASTIPAAKAALTALWDAAITSPVIVGPVIGVGVDVAVTVGYQDENIPIAVDGTLIREGMAASPRREKYAINCKLAVQSGSTDVAMGETAAFAVWSLLGSTLDANPTLNGVVMSAGVVDQFQMSEQQASDG